WKRYFNPHGSDADHYYYGTVSIPGEPFGFAKIREVANKEYPIPPPRAGIPNILKLGYLDNELDDNGYYKHDDGTFGQRKGEGPAWVEVMVLTGVKGSRLSPHSLPFDLVWNIDTDEDENGLPMNPQWWWTLKNWDQKTGKGPQPHLTELCGGVL